jgi:predicted dehydrogenase
MRNLVGLGRSVTAVRRETMALDQELRDVPVATTIREARTDGPTVALICTPTSHHVADALAAARAGCHVLIEKPLANRSDGVDDLEHELRERHLVGGVAQNLRFHPALRAVRDQIRDGDIGRPVTASVWCGQHLADWRPGRDLRTTYSASRSLGGGVVFDLIHEIDYLHWLFGDVTRVWAELSNSGTLGIETEDNAHIVMRFQSGLSASCHLDYLARPAYRGGTVTGSTGTMRWDLIAPHRLDTWDATGSHRVLLADSWTTNEMYVDEVQAFEAAVRGERGPDTTIADAARTLRTALAIHASSDRLEPA